MEDSSVPFRAFLGAILSDLKGVVVEASEFHDNQTLEAVDEGEEGPPPVSDGDDDSGEYRGHSVQGPVSHGPITRAQAALSVRPSCPPLSKNHLKFVSIDFVIFTTFSRNISSLGTSSSFPEQHLRSSAICPQWQTSLVDSLYRSWVDWQSLEVPFR